MKSFLPPASCLWVGVVLALTPPIWTYSRGASRASCQKMTPGHIQTHPQEPEHSHVSLRTSTSSYLPGQFITVTVRSSRDFMGFLLQARTTGGLNSEVGIGGGVVPGGSWALTPPGTHTLRCVSADDTLTHSDKQLKRNLSFVWKAPDRPTGDVQFYITVVQSYFVYWAGIESVVVHDGTRSSPGSSNTTVPTWGDAVTELQEEEFTSPALKPPTAQTGQTGTEWNSIKLPKPLSEAGPTPLGSTTQMGSKADDYTTSGPLTAVSGPSANDTGVSALLPSHLLQHDEGAEREPSPFDLPEQIWTDPPNLMPSPAQLLPSTEGELTVSEDTEPFAKSEPKNPTSGPSAATTVLPPASQSGRTQTTNTAAEPHHNKTTPAQAWTEASLVQLLALLTNPVLSFRHHLDPSLTQAQILNHSSGRQTAVGLSRPHVDSSRLQLDLTSPPTPIHSAPPQVRTSHTRTRTSGWVLLSPAKTQSSPSLPTQKNQVWIQTQPESMGRASEVQHDAGLLQTIQAEPDPMARTCSSPPTSTSQEPDPTSFPYTENGIATIPVKDPITAQIQESSEAPPPFSTSSHPPPTSPLPPTSTPFLRFTPSSIPSIHSSSTPPSSSSPSPSPISIPPHAPTLPPLSAPASQTTPSSSSSSSYSASPPLSSSSDALPHSESPLSSPSHKVPLPPPSSPPPSSPISSSVLSFFSSVSSLVTSPHPPPAPRRALSTAPSIQTPPRLTPGQRSLIREGLLNSPHPDAELDDTIHPPKPGANLQPVLRPDHRPNQRPPNTNPSDFHPRPGLPTPSGRPEISPGRGAWRERLLLLGASAGLGVTLAVGVRFVYRKVCGKRTAVWLNDGEREDGREERGGVIRVQECGDLVRVRRIRDNSFVLLAEYDILTPPGN